MTLQDIRINPDNHAEYDIDPNTTFSFSLTYRAALDIHLDVHRYFDAVLPENQKYDYGGRYATWLNKNGIESQSENGWWSVDAVRPENITAFVEFIKSNYDNNKNPTP